MKKLLLLPLLLLALALQAQDNTMLAKIKQANDTVRSFETDLKNTLAKSDKVTEQSGKLYFVKPKQFAAIFTTGKHMIVNVDRLKMDIGMFHGTFKIRSSGMMRSLSNIFLYGFQGHCQELANENNYTIAVSEQGPYQQVVCNNKKKSLLGIGYQTVIFNYDKNTLMLREIVLIDNSGTKDAYTISNVKYDVTVDPKRFTF